MWVGGSCCESSSIWAAFINEKFKADIRTETGEALIENTECKCLWWLHHGFHTRAHIHTTETRISSSVSYL